MSKSILFFADRLPPEIGGMEMHAHYFIRYFKDHLRYPLSTIVSKTINGEDCVLLNGKKKLIELFNLPKLCNPTFVFFNSGRWIEELSEIRALFPNAFFIYRTGGNEIVKAALIKQEIKKHSLRQKFWINQLNNHINLLITNSAYTEKRLKYLGISTPIFRVVGGVNVSALLEPKPDHSPPLTLFCAARFVPYKNHQLLLSVFKKLIDIGHQLQLRLAGVGPLLDITKALVKKYNIEEKVQFLGALENEETCKEIAKANIYIQLSKNENVEVLGGSYVHTEGMGRSILEAISAGTFVLAGQTGALSEIVTKDRGILFEMNSENAIVEEISKFLLHPIPKLPLTKEYDWNIVFKKYELEFAKIR